MNNHDRIIGGRGGHASPRDHSRHAVIINHELLEREQGRAIAAIRARFEVERSDREREIQRLKKRRLELEVEHTAKELISLAVGTVRNNVVLDELKKQIASGTVIPLGDLSSLLQRMESRRDVAQWELFEEQFRATYPVFMDRLAKQLGRAELMICMLLKAGLTTKEIAVVRYCSEQSVKAYCSRIRAKLGVAKTMALVAWLAEV